MSFTRVSTVLLDLCLLTHPDRSFFIILSVPQRLTDSFPTDGIEYIWTSGYRKGYDWRWASGNRFYGFDWSYTGG